MLLFFCLVWSATSVVVVPPPPPPPGGGGDDPTRWKHDGATTSFLQSCESRLNAKFRLGFRLHCDCYINRPCELQQRRRGLLCVAAGLEFRV